MSSEMQALIYVVYGLEIMGIMLLIDVLIRLIFYPLYKKYFGRRFRVKTVIADDGVSHYYAEFKAGYDYCPQSNSSIA